MKIDGRDIEDWGLRVIGYEGILNLPARREPTHYDWGDQIEPLVDQADIAFKPNTFSLKMFYEKVPWKKYRIGAVGLKASPAFGLQGGLFDLEGRRIFSLSRDYNIFTREKGRWLKRSFSTHDKDSDRRAMAEYLHALTPGQDVVISTLGEPQAGRLTHGIPELIYYCGGSKRVFAGPDFKQAGAYILLGRKGIGEGRGYEEYQGAIENDPSAFSKIYFPIRGHRIMFDEKDAKEFSLEHLMRAMSQAGSSYQEIITPYRTTRAKIQEIKEVQILQKDPQDSFPITAAGFTILFQEEQHPTYTYPEGLVKVERAGIAIEGYHVEENFGLLLQAFQGGHETPPLQPSPAAPYQGVRRSAARAQGELSLKFSGLFSSKTQMVEKVERFKALLASPGMKRLHYKDHGYEGHEYATYLSSGIAVKTIREHIAQLNFSLNIIEKNH